MNVNRRDFLKITGTSAAGAAILGLGLNLKPIQSHAQSLKINHCKETTSICCYCAVGCGVICSTGRAGAGKIINIEGDPDHPVNEGALCAKGASLSQLAKHHPQGRCRPPVVSGLRTGQGLEQGSVHQCVRKELVKGACEPVVFVLPEIDLEAAAQKCFPE